MRLAWEGCLMIWRLEKVASEMTRRVIRVVGRVKREERTDKE